MTNDVKKINRKLELSFDIITYKNSFPIYIGEHPTINYEGEKYSVVINNKGLILSGNKKDVICDVNEMLSMMLEMFEKENLNEN